MEQKQNEINVLPKVDLSAALSTDPLDPKTASSGYDQAIDIIHNLSNNANQQITQNHIDTIGTERGGQRSLLAGGNDNYMMSRYSTPTVESLVNTFKVASANRALTTAYDNELNRLKKEAEQAIKDRRNRDRQRAERAARAAQMAAQAQQGGGAGQAQTIGGIVAQGVEGQNGIGQGLGNNQVGANFGTENYGKAMAWLAQNGLAPTRQNLNQAANSIGLTNVDQFRALSREFEHKGYDTGGGLTQATNPTYSDAQKRRLDQIRAGQNRAAQMGRGRR